MSFNLQRERGWWVNWSCLVVLSCRSRTCFWKAKVKKNNDFWLLTSDALKSVRFSSNLCCCCFLLLLIFWELLWVQFRWIVLYCISDLMWHHKPSMHDKIHTMTPSVSPLRCQTDCKISWSFSICRSVRWRRHLPLYWNVWRVLIKTEAVQEVFVQHPSSSGASWWKQRSDVILDGSHTALKEFLSVTGSVMENVGEGLQPWVSQIQSLISM